MSGGRLLLLATGALAALLLATGTACAEQEELVICLRANPDLCLGRSDRNSRARVKHRDAERRHLTWVLRADAKLCSPAKNHRCLTTVRKSRTGALAVLSDSLRRVRKSRFFVSPSNRLRIKRLLKRKQCVTAMQCRRAGGACNLDATAVAGGAADKNKGSNLRLRECRPFWEAAQVWDVAPYTATRSPSANATTPSPSRAPTAGTFEPTAQPSHEPTWRDTPEPTAQPTDSPTPLPSGSPSSLPTVRPEGPIGQPPTSAVVDSQTPTQAPTDAVSPAAIAVPFALLALLFFAVLFYYLLRRGENVDAGGAGEGGEDAEGQGEG